jgi:hypothetical protein
MNATTKVASKRSLGRRRRRGSANSVGWDTGTALCLSDADETRQDSISRRIVWVSPPGRLAHTEPMARGLAAAPQRPSRQTRGQVRPPELPPPRRGSARPCSSRPLTRPTASAWTISAAQPDQPWPLPLQQQTLAALSRAWAAGTVGSDEPRACQPGEGSPEHPPGNATARRLTHPTRGRRPEHGVRQDAGASRVRRRRRAVCVGRVALVRTPTITNPAAVSATPPCRSWRGPERPSPAPPRRRGDGGDQLAALERTQRDVQRPRRELELGRELRGREGARVAGRDHIERRLLARGELIGGIAGQGSP